MSELIGAFIQLLVGQGLLFKADGGRIWRLPHLSFNQMVQALFISVIALGRIPISEDLLTLLLCERRDVADEAGWVLDHGLKQDLQVLGQALDARGIKEVCVVFNAAG